MSAKLAAFVDVELAQLQQLLAEHRPLLLKVRDQAPDSKGQQPVGRWPFGHC